MRHDALIGHVQALAGLPDRGTAERAVRATLVTLAERLPDGVADHLAAQLPAPLPGYVREVTMAPDHDPRQRATGERFGLTAFAGRVAVRVDGTEEAGLRQAAAVLEALDAAVGPELMDKVAGALPEDIRELLPGTRARQP